MENEHVLGGLIRKRAEIAGRLEHAQTVVRQLVIDVDNVDATIRLFAPDMDLEAGSAWRSVQGCGVCRFILHQSQDVAGKFL